jgi:hypothetical protein
MKSSLTILVALLGVACGSAKGSEDDSPGRVDASADGSGGDGASGDALDFPDAPACATASAKLIKAPVDVIVAIDGSPSMGEEQAAVIDNINTKLAAVLDAAGLDYHVVMVSGGYCFKGPLASDAPCTEPNRTKLPRFFHSVQAVNNSDALTLLLWTYDGYTRPPNTCDKKAAPALKWRDQLRAEAMKYFVVVTDDDPSSFDYTYANARALSETGVACPAKPGKIDSTYCAYWNCPTFADKTADWGGEGFEKELYKLTPAGMFGSETNRKWVFHAIVGVPSELAPEAPVAPLTPACSEDGNTGENTGTEYQLLAKRTGGVRFPVCRTATGGGYAPVFSKISSKIVGVTACEYKLSSTGLGMIDLARVNVSLDPGDGTGNKTIPNDATKPCDGGANGWQYKDGGSTIVLCGAACEASKSAKAKVSVYVGCATELVK